MPVIKYFSNEGFVECAQRRLVIRTHSRSQHVGDVKVLLACCKGDEMEVVVWEEKRCLRVQRFTPAIAGGVFCLELLANFCDLFSEACCDKFAEAVEAKAVMHFDVPGPQDSSASALYLLPIYGRISEQLKVVMHTSSQGEGSCLRTLQERLDAFIRGSVANSTEALANLSH